MVSVSSQGSSAGQTLYKIRILNTTCRRRSCCGSTRAGRPTGSSPCLRYGSRTRTGRAPAPLRWPPLPPPEGGAAGPGPGQLWRMTGPTRPCLCSSLTPPRTLREEIKTKHIAFINSLVSVLQNK